DKPTILQDHQRMVCGTLVRTNSRPMRAADSLPRRAATKWQQVSARERDRKVTIRRRDDTPIRREAGLTLVEMSVALFLLTAVATFTMRTIASAWLEQNWSIL